MQIFSQRREREMNGKTRSPYGRGTRRKGVAQFCISNMNEVGMLATLQKYQGDTLTRFQVEFFNLVIYRFFVFFVILAKPGK